MPYYHAQHRAIAQHSYGASAHWIKFAKAKKNYEEDDDPEHGREHDDEWMKETREECAREARSEEM